MLHILSLFMSLPSCHTHVHIHITLPGEFGLCFQISSKSSLSVIYGKPSLTSLGSPLYCLKGIELQFFFIVATVYLPISLPGELFINKDCFFHLSSQLQSDGNAVSGP